MNNLILIVIDIKKSNCIHVEAETQEFDLVIHSYELSLRPREVFESFNIDIERR